MKKHNWLIAFTLFVVWLLLCGEASTLSQDNTKDAEMTKTTNRWFTITPSKGG